MGVMKMPNTVYVSDGKIEHEVTWDGRTVWVNSGNDGSNIARFTPFGVDVHTTATEQMVGTGQCHACTSEPNGTTRESWDLFVAKVREHHSIEVPIKAMPIKLQA